MSLRSLYEGWKYALAEEQMMGEPMRLGQVYTEPEGEGAIEQGCWSNDPKKPSPPRKPKARTHAAHS